MQVGDGNILNANNILSLVKVDGRDTVFVLPQESEYDRNQCKVCLKYGFKFWDASLSNCVLSTEVGSPFKNFKLVKTKMWYVVQHARVLGQM